MTEPVHIAQNNTSEDAQTLPTKIQLDIFVRRDLVCPKKKCSSSTSILMKQQFLPKGILATRYPVNTQ